MNPDEWVGWVNGDKVQGQGTIVFTAGTPFDINKLHKAQVILNRGTDMEITGEKKELPIAKLVISKKQDLAAVDEIKFGNGSNVEKKYDMSLLTQSLLKDCASLSGKISVVNKNGQLITVPGVQDEYYLAEYPLEFPEAFFGGCKVRVKDMTDNGDLDSYFVLSNQSRESLSGGFLGNPALIDTVVLYGGIGNTFKVEVNGAKKYLPIEPVGVIVLGIDGLRQDVLYAQGEQQVNDPNGSNYYVQPSELEGLCDVLGGTRGLLSCDIQGWEKKHIKLSGVTAIFPSITYASWASIFTGKQPGETGIMGNEYFARDLYEANTSFEGLPNSPIGMVTYSSGAFMIGNGGFLNEPRFYSKYVIPADWYDDVYKSNAIPARTLQVKTVYEEIAPIITGYNLSPDQNSKCDNPMSPYECKSVVVFNHYAKGADRWRTISSFKPIWDQIYGGTAYLMDSTPASEAVDFITQYFKNNNAEGKRKRFPALFTIYFAGLDHYAHDEGMTGYTDFFKGTTDDQIKEVVNTLRVQDELNNKIFIIVSDHGHTAMPTNLKYERTQTYEDEFGLPYDVIDSPFAEMSCKLNLDLDSSDAKEAERHNNNLHIWELGEVFKAVGKFTGGNFSYRVLAPEPIATLFSEEAYGARVALPDANLIASLNGPMAHIYVTNSAEISRVAEMFRLTMQGEYLPEAIKWFSVTEKGYKDLRSSIGKMNLKSSIEKILVRVSADANYCVFDGLNDDGSARCAVSDPFDAASYVDAWIRINGMNHKNRSGDIVLIMKDATTGNATDRYTTGVACKSWHGSLNPSDSYVPFIASYPGGNKSELEKILQKDSLCKTDYSNCKGNWKLTDIVKEIISEQYK